MGWRKAWVCNVERDDPDGLTYKLLDRLSAALLDMPAADRIALARELLAGTGWVVAREAPKSFGAQDGRAEEWREIVAALLSAVALTVAAWGVLWLVWEYVL